MPAIADMWCPSARRPGDRGLPFCTRIGDRDAVLWSLRDALWYGDVCVPSVRSVSIDSDARDGAFR